MSSIPAAPVELVPSGYNTDRREDSCSGCNLKCPMLLICDRCMPDIQRACLGISLGEKILEREVCDWVYANLKFFF